MLALTSEPQNIDDKGHCERSDSTSIGGEPDAGSDM